MEDLGGQKGWTVLPCDTPQEGTRGYVAFREVDGDGEPIPEGKVVLEGQDLPPSWEGPKRVVIERHEQSRAYLWPAFGKWLEPRRSTVSLQDLLTFIQDHPDASLADSPEERLLGYAYPDFDSGVLHVRQIPIPVLAAEDDVIKSRIRDKHDSDKDESAKASDETVRRAAALTGAIRGSG